MNEFEMDNLISYNQIKGYCNAIMTTCKNTIKNSWELKEILSQFGSIDKVENICEFDIVDLEPCQSFIKNIEVNSDSGYANSILTAYIHKKSLQEAYETEIYFIWNYDRKGSLILETYKLEVLEWMIL